MKNKKHGDFTGLAENYSNYRPAYSQSALTALLSLVDKPVSEIDFADVGAGTGIWTKMVAQRKCRSSVAVEPNDDMRSQGINATKELAITWLKGSGEETGLEADSIDLLTMASSFHWVDFEKGMKEFACVLRQGGRFAALWNPRYIEANPLLVEIEEKLLELVPDLTRVSSGRSGITQNLTKQLRESPLFHDVIYIEGYHIERQTPEHYLGLWQSVNDIRVQAGEERFQAFLSYIESRIKGMDYIEATYLTRIWSAKKR